MTKKKSTKKGDCPSCHAKRIVGNVCTACGIAVKEPVKPKDNGSD